MDRETMVRVTALYVPLCLTAALWIATPPGRRDRAAIFLAAAWNVPALLGVHVLAARLGWWTYDARGATLAGMPVDLLLGWVVLWGALPVLLSRYAGLLVVVVVAIAADLVAMPLMFPIVRLGPSWLVGEAVAILACLVPAQLLGRWTRDGTHVTRRAALQVLVFGGTTFGVLPQVIFDQVGGSWATLTESPGWIAGFALQIVALGALPGVSAVQEFATRGRGTPIPFDPPLRLVMSGPYAYVRNPMQLSAAIAMAAWGATLGSWWVAAAGVMAVIYAAGFAAGDEHVDLEARLGDSWSAYARAVRSWWPRWRPVDVAALDLPGYSRAVLYVAEECGPCSEVRAWLEARSPIGLDVVPAERHPTRSLTRITYSPGDGTSDSKGVAALGRALEHLHFGWALLGMFMRLPILSQALQLITDASGGGPREVVRHCERPVPIRSA